MADTESKGGRGYSAVGAYVDELSEPVKRSISERTDEEERVADDITMQYGAAWVLVSATSDGDGLGIQVALGPAMDIDLTRRLLIKTLDVL